MESLDCAVAAERGGAHRVELCGDLAVGGVTPALELMRAARDQVSLPIHVMIRPRAGKFCYTDSEFEAMQKEIAMARQLGMNGIVLGMLDSGNHVDVERTRKLVDLAHPLAVTFHRAFDDAADLLRALEAVSQTGAERILTSGGCTSAVLGAKTLAQLVAAAAGRVIVMPAAGIDAENVGSLIRLTHAREVHASLGSAGMGRSASGAAGTSSVEVLAFEGRVRKLVAAIAAIDDVAE